MKTLILKPELEEDYDEKFPDDVTRIVNVCEKEGNRMGKVAQIKHWLESFGTLIVKILRIR